MTRRIRASQSPTDGIPNIDTGRLRLDAGAARLVADWADTVFDPAIYGDTRIQCARQHIEQARTIEARYAQWQHDDADDTKPGRAFVDYGLIRKAKAARVDTEARIHGAFWIVALIHDTYHSRKYSIIDNLANIDWPGPLMRWQAHAAVRAMQSGCSEKLAGWFVTEEAVDAMKAVAGALAKAEARNGAKRRRRRIAGADIRPLTAKQVEAVSMVNQCEGNIAEAARRMGKDRATVEQHYRAANEKLGAKIVRRGRGLPSTQALPTDGRAQADVYTDDEGAIREGRRYDGKRRKGRSADDD